MSGKDELLRNAQRRGVRRPLEILIKGTEELTDWEFAVGKRADCVSYTHPASGRVMIRYGWRVSPDRLLDVDVNKRNNQFGSVFGIEEDEVYTRLVEYLPHAVQGGEDDYVAIRSTTDAEKLIEFLRSLAQMENQ